MNGRPLTDAQISRALRARLPEGAPAGLGERTLEMAERTSQERSVPSFLRILSDADPSWHGRYLLAAALLIVLVLSLAAGIGAWLASRPSQFILPAPDPKLTWSQVSLEGDWPAAVRFETSGGAVLPIEIDGEFADPSRDVVPMSVPWLDIETVRRSNLGPGRGTVVSVILAADVPTDRPEPRVQWIAYGLVLDTNADGVPDVRLGVDNVPFDLVGRAHRAWRTDLHTGLTTAAVGPPYGGLGDVSFDTFYPGERSLSLASFGLILLPEEERFRFYTWASLIEDGRVVGTDYAPDHGWLDADVSN